MKNFMQAKKWGLSLGAALLALGFAAGCGATHHAYLVPAPTDNLTSNGSATATAENVTITVTPNAWNGKPGDLDKRVTPLKVRIENHSKQAIRVVYSDFDLHTAHGQILAALPPSDIKGTQYVGENRLPAIGGAQYVPAAYYPQDTDNNSDVDAGTRVVITPGFDSDDFYYAPYWDYGYVGMGPWPYAWVPDWGYYNSYYPYMQKIHLPTRSMLRKGIPEGVIAPGGYVQGFIYFKKVNPKLNTVNFVAKLQAAKTGQQFGTVRIPFTVKTKKQS